MKQTLKGQKIEEVLRKFAKNNDDHISEDDLLLGLSKLNSNLHLKDVKDFSNIVKQ